MADGPGNPLMKIPGSVHGVLQTIFEFLQYFAIPFFLLFQDMHIANVQSTALGTLVT